MEKVEGVHLSKNQHAVLVGLLSVVDFEEKKATVLVLCNRSDLQTQQHDDCAPCVAIAGEPVRENIFCSVE